jgi:hypothetical protein
MLNKAIAWSTCTVVIWRVKDLIPHSGKDLNIKDAGVN